MSQKPEAESPTVDRWVWTPAQWAYIVYCAHAARWCLLPGHDPSVWATRLDVLAGMAENAHTTSYNL